MMWPHIIQHSLCDEWKCIEYGSFQFIENVMPIFIQEAICCFTQYTITIEQIIEICIHSRWSCEGKKQQQRKRLRKLHISQNQSEEWPPHHTFRTYLVILNVIRRLSVYKCVLPFLTFDLPVKRTKSSGFSSVKLHRPWPCMGNTRIWPLIEYGPSRMNCGPVNRIS